MTHFITEFYKEFHLDKALTEAQRRYLVAFSQTQRSRRNVDVVNSLADPLRQAVGLPIGRDGGYYVGGDTSDGTILADRPSQPSRWCHWIPNDNGTAIIWNGRTDFSNFINWIEYLIEHFLAPWGYKLNGTVQWNVTNCYANEGVIVIRNNRTDVICFEDDDDR